MSQSVEAIPHKTHRRSRSKFKRFRKRLLRLFNLRWIIIAALAIASVVIVGSLVIATDATSRMNNSIANLSRVLGTIQTRPGTELTLADFQRLRDSVNELQRTLGRVSGQLGLFRIAAPLNSDLNATFSALDITGDLADAVEDVLVGVEPTLFYLVAGEEEARVVRQISGGERIVELLELGRSRFLDASASLDSARARLDALSLTGISPTMLLNMLTLSTYEQQFRAINESLLLAPDALQFALGLDAQQSYLVLSQNSDELRPSGGYISTYGWITIRSGRILDYDYSATTQTSPTPPTIDSPYRVPEWWIQYREPLYAAWDGSWYADFQRTAQMAVWYYNNGNNPERPVAGAFGIDLYGVEMLLDVIGPVAVPGYDITVTNETFREAVYNIRAFGSENEHKRFVGALYREIFGRWQNLGQDQQVSAQTLGVLLRALQEKHLMIYFADEQLNQIMGYLGWSGSQSPAIDHDYLMVADANLGNKSNRSILRQLTYDVAINADGRLDSRATVTYDYPRALAEADPAVDAQYHGPLNYANLLQVFTPVGSRLTPTDDLPGRVEVIDDPAHTIFITRLRVEYGGGERIQLPYTSLSLIETLGSYRRYRLLIQKQAGTPPDLVNVQVSLPPQAQLVHTLPEASATYNLDRPIVEFRVELISDRWIEVIYR